MKKIIVLFIFLIIIFLNGCTKTQKLEYDDFYFEIINDNEVSIGDVKTYPESHAVFVPYYVSNYKVTRLGFSSLGFGGNGCFVNVKQGSPRIERFYCPSSINYVSSGYMSLAQTYELKVFYCGEILNVGNFDLQVEEFEVYVPLKEYDDFVTASVGFLGKIVKANFVYDINCDVDCYYNHYYYIDYIENGETIKITPPTPTRDGYTFDGWYQEKECINEWNFENEILLGNDGDEIRVFAKWNQK